MVGDGSTDGFLKNRPVLADVTNQHGKRGLSSISSGSGLNSGNGSRKNLEDKLGDSEFTQQVCLGVENLVRGKCRREFVEDGNGEGLSLLKAKGICRSVNLGSGSDYPKHDIASVISRVPNETKDLSNRLDAGLHILKGNAMMHRIPEKSDGSRNSCASSVSMLGGPKKCNKSGSLPSLMVEGRCQDDKESVIADITRNTPGIMHVNEGLDNHVLGDASNKSTFAGSSASKGIELERCMGSDSDGGSNASLGVDLLKACSCSFCLKAAYIWSDLHYQDIKGRIAALKRSQKEIKLMVDRSWTQGENDKNHLGNFNKSTKLESDLMGLWKSLFLHTEDILVRESSQLQSSLLTLNGLRGSCKTDLEMINGMPSNK